MREITPEQLPGIFTEIGQQVETMEFRRDLEHIADDLRRDERSFFIAASSPAGQAWKPLSPLTVELKGHSTILVDTQEMMRSVTVQGHRDAIERIASNELTFGTRDPKAAKHQYGIGVPKRSFVGITRVRADKHIPTLIADAVVEKLKAGA